VAPQLGRAHDDRPAARRRRVRRHRAIAAIGLSGLVLAVAPGLASGARVPHVGVLPALHDVATWVTAGVKVKDATAGVKAQLANNEYAWLPKSQCLVTAISSSNATPCVLGDTSSTSTVVLFGDSSADEWALDVGALGTAHGFRVVVYVHAACPVGNVVVSVSGQSPDPSCPTFRSLVLADLAAMRPAPDLVVVSELRLSNYETASRTKLSNAVWSRALTTTLDTIEGDGSPVALLHGVPVAKIDPASCIAAYPTAMTRCEIRAKDADPSGYDHATWLGAHTAHAAGVNVLALFCTASSCPPVARGDVTHSGLNHVTERYAALVRPALGELLGCAVTQSFTHRAAATPVLDGLLGSAPSATTLRACAALPR
jgi:SGNH domain (fused to AT3 domains)